MNPSNPKFLSLIDILSELAGILPEINKLSVSVNSSIALLEAVQMGTLPWEEATKRLQKQYEAMGVFLFSKEQDAVPAWHFYCLLFAVLQMLMEEEKGE